ncbi:hypothetical protein [Planococcus halocryophilus]|uniref:hypothetical protein n=1 Tax=Planococcus halocryophilus TaxID=1215089 RepID=UPI0003493111
MGVQDLPGGVVLTGGMAKLDGLPELARNILQTRVRLFTPEFIGVREPQYTTAVGLIQYAYMEDVFYGRIGNGGAVAGAAKAEQQEVQQPKKQKQPKQNSEGVVTKAKKMFDRFFE